MLVDSARLYDRALYLSNNCAVKPNFWITGVWNQMSRTPELTTNENTSPLPNKTNNTFKKSS